MSTQTITRKSTTANDSAEKPAFNLNASIQRVRAKWNAATRERREQLAKARQEQLVSMLLGAENFSHSID